MSSIKKDPFSLVDDDLDGVDDFTNEPNPFESSQHADSVPQDFDGHSMATTALPNYDDVIESEAQQAAQEPYSNVSDMAGRSQQQQQPQHPALDRGELPPGLINYYSRFFQLSTETFKGRFIRSLSLNKLLFESETPTGENRELFGAIWITCSIVLVKFLFPGLINLVYYGVIRGERVNDSLTSTDREKIYWNLIHSIWLFGIYSFVVPFIVLQIILKDDTNGEGEEGASSGNGEDTAAPGANRGNMVINPSVKNLVGLVTVYGYGNSIWLFILPLLDIVNRFRSTFKTAVAAEWAIIAIAYVKAAQYMHVQICNRGNGHVRLPFTMIFILGFHIIFSVLLMFTLY